MNSCKLVLKKFLKVDIFAPMNQELSVRHNCSSFMQDSQYLLQQPLIAGSTAPATRAELSSTLAKVLGMSELWSK